MVLNTLTERVQKILNLQDFFLDKGHTLTIFLSILVRLSHSMNIWT